MNSTKNVEISGSKIESKYAKIQINIDSMLSNRSIIDNSLNKLSTNQRKSIDFTNKIIIPEEEIEEKVSPKLFLRKFYLSLFIQFFTTILTSSIFTILKLFLLSYSNNLLMQFILVFVSSTVLLFLFIVGIFFAKTLKNYTNWCILFNFLFGHILGLFYFSLGIDFLLNCACFYFGFLTIIGIMCISTYLFDNCLVFWKVYIVSTLPCLLLSPLIYLMFMNNFLFILLVFSYCYFSFCLQIFGQIICGCKASFYDVSNCHFPSFMFGTNFFCFFIKFFILIFSEKYNKSTAKIVWR